MNKYTIYCTEEQTKKALELGAPIEVHDTFDSYDIKESNIFYKDKFIELPDDRLIERITAEQMLGWLRSKGFRFKIVEHESYVYWQYSIDDYFDHNNKPSAKEATLAAIDAALEYLSNNKK